jgi:hypothetical protein
VALNWNSNVTALLVIASTLWFGDHSLRRSSGNHGTILKLRRVSSICKVI